MAIKKIQEEEKAKQNPYLFLPNLISNIEDNNEHVHCVVKYIPSVSQIILYD